MAKAATKPEMSVVPQESQVPAYIKKGPARGNEGVAVEDIQIPRLEIVQDLSPILKTNDEAESGMLYNSVTEEIYGHQVTFVPILFNKQFIVWKDRKQGGGFRGAFKTPQEAQARVNEAVAEGDNPKHLTITPTPIHYGLLLLDDGRKIEIVISMPRSKEKVSKRFNSMIQLAEGDRFARSYTVGTADAKSPGGDYYNFAISPQGWTPEDVYRAAEKIYERVAGQMINVAHGEEESVEPEAEY